MGYSLGDDKESFYVFDNSISICQKIGEKLIKNNWIYDKEKYSFSKNNRNLKLELSQDHITSLYISDDTVDWEKFVKQNGEFEPIYDDDKIACVEIYIYKTMNIKKLIAKLEYAPLLEKEADKDIDIDL